MKKALLVLALILGFSITAFSSSASKVVVIPVKKEIGSTTWNYVKNGFILADSVKSDAVLIHMNTYGGQVIFADSIRSRILNYEKPVHIFIDNNAASAGALIAIACDSIYMRDGGTIGAATVVNQSGEAAPDKYQSYMRATIRATAEAQGKDTVIVDGDTTYVWRRNPKIAEAMVDQSLYVAGVSDTGKLLTFTVNEAIENGFCEGTAKTIEEVLEKVGLSEAEIIHYEPSTYDNIKGFLLNPVFHGILIMLILGGIYFELQSPGIGFPLIIAIGAAILYFAPLYIDGLAAYWEMALFIVGVILIALEIFVIPGFGVAGIAGGVLAFTGLLLSMINNVNFTFKEVETEPMVVALATTTLAFLLGTTLMIWMTGKFWGRGKFNKLALGSTQRIEEGYVAVDVFPELIDREGTALTDLRPSGKITVDGDVYDAMALVGLIEKGTKVKVVKQEAGQMYVVTI
jgi:membrane-bound serine protease (ClpP class)